MISVRRWDAAQPLPKATRTPEGFLRAPETRVARSGIQTYKREDGTTQVELRLDTEVFSTDSLDSLNGKPVVHNHPGRVDAFNAKSHMGGVAMQARQDGDFVVADIVLHDAGLIRAVERGDSEVSLGYHTTLVPITGGVFRQDGHPLDGTRADYLQTRIVHNHVALLPKGRANEGLSDRPVRLRLDSANNLVSDEEVKLMKVQINGVEFDVSEEVAKAISAQNSAHAAQLSAVKQEVTAASARADAASKKAESESARADSAQSKLDEIEAKQSDQSEKDKRAAEEVERFNLLTDAKSVLKLDASDLSKLSNFEIKKRIVLKRRSGMKLDGASEDFVAAAYEFSRVDAPKNSAADLARHITRMEHNTAREDQSESPLVKRHREIKEASEKRKGA